MAIKLEKVYPLRILSHMQLIHKSKLSDQSGLDIKLDNCTYQGESFRMKKRAVTGTNLA